jgi:hypothetical protein
VLRVLRRQLHGGPVRRATTSQTPARRARQRTEQQKQSQAGEQ